MSANQQRWMGGIILLGGSALLASFLFQGTGHKESNPQAPTVNHTLNLDGNRPVNPGNAPVTATAPTFTDLGKPAASATNPSISSPSSDATGQPVQLTPLGVDVETEQKLLAAQHQMREKKVAEQEARTAEFLARQQQAEADSARKVANEQAERSAARKAKLDDAQSTDPAAPDVVSDAGTTASADDATSEAAKKAEQRRIAARDQAEQMKLRALQAAQKHDHAAQVLAAASAKTAKAKAERIAAEQKQAADEHEQRLLEAKQHAEKIAKEKQAKLDAEKEKKAIEAKLHKEKLSLEKQAKLDEAQAKKDADKAARIKLQQAEKAERARLRGLPVDTEQQDAELAALQAKMDKNKKEAAELKAKLEKLHNGSTDPSAKTTAKVEATKTDTSKADKPETQKAKDDRARALLDGAPAPTLVMVQVAMAESQAKADSVVAQLRAKGYKVRTSTTNKGVRVLVGPEKDTAAATATKHKIEQDDSLNLKGAWVSNWQPPTS